MDYLEQLAKVFKGVTYKGCRIGYYSEMFHVFGKEYLTWDEAKKSVDDAKDSLNKSIK